MNREWMLKLADFLKYTAFLKYKFLGICPYGEDYLKRLLLKTVGLTGTLFVVSTVVLVFWNALFQERTLVYMFGSVLLLWYVIAMEVPNYVVQKKETMLYQEWITYLSRVKHRYVSSHHIPNSVLEAADSMSYEIQRHSGELYQILTEGERKERVREYVLNNRANRYMKLFLVQAYEASEKGDIALKEGGSLFSDNVEYLRGKVMEELYRRKKSAYEFAGYTFVAVAPFFMMPVFKQWGLDFAPELNYFYAGIGQLLELITLCGTMAIYGFINRAKEMSMFTERRQVKRRFWERVYQWKIPSHFINSLEKWGGEFSQKVRELLLQSGEHSSFGQLCLRMFGITFLSFTVSLTFLYITHRQERHSVLRSVETMESIAPFATETGQKELENLILTIVKKYKNRPEIVIEEIQNDINSQLSGSLSIKESLEKEIITKLEQYQKSKITLFEVVLCFLVSLLFGIIPLFQIWYQVQTSMAGALHEIKQFQSVIIMERRLHGITILSLLEDMEAFSRLFKGILRRCINSYSSGPLMALQRMKEEGGKLHESFAELADAFLSVDEAGITLAFAEVENNRALLEKMSQLEAEINMEKKKDMTDLISKIPMALAVGAYFIIPFFVFSLQGVYEIFELLEELQG